MATTANGVTINEIRIDQTSTDNDEYFELADSRGESLDGLTYIVLGDGTGGSGVIEMALDLTGSSIPADGYFLAVEDTFGAALSGSPDLTLAPNAINFESSDNVTHMLVSGVTGANSDDLDTDDDGVLDVTPWSSIVDSIALVENLDNPPTGTEWYYGPTVGPDGIYVPGHDYRYENGTGPWQIGPFEPVGGLDTPGTDNLPEPVSLALLGLGGLLIRRRR